MLQDIVAPDLKALTVKVDGIQKQLELSEKSVTAQLDAFRKDHEAFRAEMVLSGQKCEVSFRPSATCSRIK